MTEPGPGRSLEERVSDLETVTTWLTAELVRMSERLGQATGVEAIIRRARQASPGCELDVFCPEPGAALGRGQHPDPVAGGHECTPGS